MDRPHDAIWLLDPEGATEEDFEQALVHWDDLDEASLRALSDHPVHGRRLDALQLAEAWLESRVEHEMPPAAKSCPPSEELYDYARGPGAATLPRGRRARIDRHLVDCRPCESIARGLQRRPPAPLEDLPEPEVHDAAHRELIARLCEPAPTPAQVRKGSLLRFAPLAAAASLVLVLGWQALRPESISLPPVEAVRGIEADALLAPAGPLLWVAPEAATALLPAGSAPHFELAPVDGATAYTVEILRHDGGALSEGEPVATLESQEPILGPHHLDPGRYTWRARATVRGLDALLGAREIRVERRPKLALELADASRLEAVVRLHEAGLLSDARRLAAGLPPSPERDAYLEGGLPR